MFGEKSLDFRNDSPDLFIQPDTNPTGSVKKINAASLSVARDGTTVTTDAFYCGWIGGAA